MNTPGFYIVTILFSMLCGLFIYNASHMDLYGIFTILAGLIIIIFISSRNRPLAIALIAAFLVRSMLAMIDYFIAPLPGSTGDAIRFERIGWDLAQVGFPAILEYFGTGSRLYRWVIGMVYLFTDRSPLMIQGINVFFGALVVYNVYKITDCLWNEKVALRAAWFIAIYPNMAMWSSVILRETFIIYPLSLGIMFFVYWSQTQKTRYLIIALLSVTISAAFHQGVFIILIVLCSYVAIKWLHAFLSNYGTSFVRYTGLIAIVVMLILTSYSLGMDFGFQRSMDRATLEDMEQIQERAARERAAYLSGMVVRTPVDVIWQTPIRVVYFLFTPFIWMVSTVGDIIGFIDTLIYIILIAGIIRSWDYIKNNPTAKMLLIIFSAVLIIFALYTSNYGTALRHRAKLAPILVSLVVVNPIKRERSFQRENIYIDGKNSNIG